MASNVTMTVYLGAGEDGLRRDNRIKEAAAKLNMKKSEFVLYCVDQMLKFGAAIGANTPAPEK